MRSERELEMRRFRGLGRGGAQRSDASPESDRITLEELAFLLRDAVQSTLVREDPPRIRGEPSSLDLEELSRLMIIATARQGRWPSNLDDN